jgi:hypothetical protein
MLRSFSCLSISFAGLLAAACASRAPAPRFPPRRPSCALSIFHTDLPTVPDWDDIGKVEVICHIDDTESTCFSRLRAEVCRMGGDIIYRLPRKVWRPSEQTEGYAMGYRAMVAHTRRPASNAKAKAIEVGDAPPSATPEEAAGPVVPLTGPAAPGPAAPGLPAPPPVTVGTASSDAGAD